MGGSFSVPKPTANKQSAIDFSKDRFPDLDTVLARIMHDEEFPQGAVQRVEITCLASHEATWRAWPPKSDEPVGGFYNFDEA
jgi:hypothetical protein